MKHKLKEWTKRYTGPEILGLLGAYAGVLTYELSFNSPSEIIASIWGTWGENIGYYSCIFTKDYKQDKLNNPNTPLFKRLLKISKNILFEFGISEALDSFLVRPICLFFAINYFGLSLGVLIGKLAADLIFYCPTILFYELQKKLTKE